MKNSMARWMRFLKSKKKNILGFKARCEKDIFAIPLGNQDIKMGIQRPVNSGELGLGAFFNQNAHEESKAITKPAAIVGTIARSIKSRIEELDRENLANRQKRGCGQGSVVDRSRTSTTIALKNKFKDKMSEFQVRLSAHYSLSGFHFFKFCFI
ncbi:putative syntaxin-131 [Phtheirospermum japonicum]|uniref:Putative syntaxin-131 n=1 Tax=Phtheirospermum japonicum TaxID=374723 RepID=A0A830CLZ4_9LAMI|nr:putative syntaxin-131 [Phtheirospermum japonicum]